VFRLKLRLHGQDVKDLALESGREYTFGRSVDCDVQLEEQPGISRVHFKLTEVDGEWEVQVLSKFGDLTFAGSPIQNLRLEEGTVFKLAGYDFLFTERAATLAQEEPQEEDHQNMPMAVGQSEVNYNAPSSSNLPARLQPVDFEGSDESTRIIESSTSGLPFIRLVEGSGKEETIKLEGRKWIAGREEGSQILLNDRKASRKQFELSTSPQGNFIRDLGSSNGTLLNGMPLAADELKAIRSGDVIQVGALAIHFEVRDPNFERRLMVVPQEVLSATPAVIQQMPYEMINYPVPTGPGGAVRVDGANAPALYEGQQWDERAVKEAKAKKFRFYLIAIIVIALPVYFLMDQPEKPKKKPKVEANANDPLSKLTPQQQQQVKELMVLGRNLFMQGKQAMAAEQLRKLHEILPTGYENSLAIAQECAEQERIENARRAVERELQQAAENRVIVDQNLKKCEPLANQTMNEGELRTCLAPTYERDPANPRLEDYLNRVRARIAERDAKITNQKNYSASVGRGKALFANAERLEKQGDLDSAVEAYGKHVSSNFPDPENLKTISRKKISSMQANKSAAIAKYLEAAQLAFTNQNYPAAVNNINKIKGLDPQNMQAAELNANIQKQKNQKLREIYEESVINEGLGQIDQAKTNWKKILDMDHPDGQYYKRAKSKMKAFGGS
jgi:pSer/pThr/pTyr-binding forkhead associated (FHA) protein